MVGFSTSEPALEPCAASDADPRLVEAMVRILELDAELAGARRSIADLTAALETNRDIGAAIGIVMATRGVDSGAAFDLLRQVSQARHTKLRDVAREVVALRRLMVPPEAAPNGRPRAVPAPPPVLRERA
jgi:AmiR/NasT family two-component response regulator